MTISLKHVFESPVADNGDADLVGPDEWNAEHALTQATSTILGRVTAGTGATEELTATQVRTLINVEDGSTGDMSAAEILAALITVDGTGSGLDADLLDGQSGAYYLAWGNFTGTPTTLAGYGITDAQPLDSDLTAIAALTTTTYGRSLLELADESALEASIDTLANLTSVQGLAVAYADAGADALWGWDDSGSTYTNLSAADALVALGVTASAAELNALDGITATVTELNYTDGVTSAIQTQLDGKQPLDASLTAYAALTTAADKGIYFSAADTPVTYDLTAYGRTLAGLADETALEALLDTLPNLTSIQSLTITLADAGADAVFGWDDSAGVYQNLTAADARTALGLVIGTNVQAYDADLTTLSTAFTTASASGAASLDFHEDTDNGTNRVRLQGPASTADVTLTLPAATDTLVGKATTDTLTNKTFDANGTGNSLSNVEVADFAAAAIVTEADTISANDNDTTIPTSAAVKAYADSVVGSGVTDGDKGDVVVSGGGATWLLDYLAVGLHAICEGRLTLTSGTPVTTSDVTAAGTLYFTPFRGNRIALYSGTAWEMLSFAETSLALTLTSGKPYDIWGYNNAGTLALESLVWTDDTNRATALALQDGIYVKTGATTRRYLGTIYASGANTTEDSKLKRYVWNACNRVVRPMWRHDDNTNWNYTTATWRQANASTANEINFVRGLDEDTTEAHALALASNSTGAVVMASSIGLDSTTATATDASIGFSTDGAGSIAAMPSFYRGLPGIGRHRLTWLEFSNATGTTTFFGDQATNYSKTGIWGSMPA